MSKAEDEDVVNNNLPVIHIHKLLGLKGPIQLGVTHFHHINDNYPNLITLLFSAGRHDGGSNTF